MKLPDINDMVSENGFRLISSITYETLPDFVIDRLRRPNLPVILFYILLLAMAVFALFIRLELTALLPLKRIIPFTLAGLLLLPLLLVPLHEGIHIASLWLSGIKNIKAGADLKNFMFYVTAHRQVVGPLCFIVSALAPLLLISVLILIVLPLLGPPWQWAASLTLAVHASMCAGDIALIAFYYSNRKKKIYTWDDANQKVAYFYEQIIPDQ